MTNNNRWLDLGGCLIGIAERKAYEKCLHLQENSDSIAPRSWQSYQEMI